MNERRNFLRTTIGVTAASSGLVIPTQSFAAGSGIPWSKEALSGQILSGNELEFVIAELNDQRSLISLANDKALSDECAMVAAQAQNGIKNLTKVRGDLSGNLSDAQITLAISLISGTVGTIGAIMFAFTNAPAWIALGLGVGTASAAWSLIQFTHSSGTDKAFMGVSHFSGRFSVVGATEAASAAAKTAGSCLSALAALADLYSAVKAGVKILDVNERLERVSADLNNISKQYLAYSNNLSTCRAARLAEIDATILATEFVRDLGDISLDSGGVILP